jgi:hypothetical protein
MARTFLSPGVPALNEFGTRPCIRSFSNRSCRSESHVYAAIGVVALVGSSLGTWIRQFVPREVRSLTLLAARVQAR